MNNRLQLIDIATAEARELAAERAAFEVRWNRWNATRTAMSVTSTALVVVVAVRL